MSVQGLSSHFVPSTQIHKSYTFLQSFPLTMAYSGSEKVLVNTKAFLKDSFSPYSQFARLMTSSIHICHLFATVGIFWFLPWPLQLLHLTSWPALRSLTMTPRHQYTTAPWHHDTLVPWHHGTMTPWHLSTITGGVHLIWETMAGRLSWVFPHLTVAEHNPAAFSRSDSRLGHKCFALLPVQQ